MPLSALLGRPRSLAAALLGHPRSLATLSLIALAVLLASPARAAHWAVAYACNGTNTTSPAAPIAWTPTQADPAKESCGYGRYTSAISNGTLTATLTWTKDGEPTLPPAPNKIYLLQTLNCSANGSSAGCTATDNWGDTFPGSGTTSCSGQFAHSLQVDNIPVKTTLTLQPVTASASAYNTTGAGGNCYSSIQLTTAVVNYALDITFTGTLLDGTGTNNILVGPGLHGGPESDGLYRLRPLPVEGIRHHVPKLDRHSKLDG